jgi:hypothetical protein
MGRLVAKQRKSKNGGKPGLEHCIFIAIRRKGIK